ncbi:MAG: hypothetical protein CFE26_27550, partial [Verrucomicrobiales bacterium VVV1]
MSNGQVRYRTADFEVGFHLARPGFSFLGLHTEDPANIGTNLLSAKPAFFAQGPQLHELGTAPALIPSVRCDITGKTRVRGATVAYDFTVGAQRYRLTTRDTLAWVSGAWTIGFRNSVAPSHALGRLVQEGEAGALALPLLVNFPRFGTWELASSSPLWGARSDCFRSSDLNILELKLGEQRTAEGLHRLPKGRFTATLTLRPKAPPAALRPAAP